MGKKVNWVFFKGNCGEDGGDSGWDRRGSRCNRGRKMKNKVKCILLTGSLHNRTLGKVSVP